MRGYGDPVSDTSNRRGRPSTISADDVVRTAVALIDEVGVEKLTMRALAAELGVAPMTLYRHVADKQALLASIPDALLEDVAHKVCRKRTGRMALTAVAEGLAAVLTSHTGAARLFEQPELGPHMRLAAGHVTSLLVAEGLSTHDAHTALRAVVAQVIGEVITQHGPVNLAGVRLLLDGVAHQSTRRERH